MTYKAIQTEYRRLYNKTIKSCWIAHVKREMKLTTRMAYNRLKPDAVKYPCEDPEIRARIRQIIIIGNT